MILVLTDAEVETIDTALTWLIRNPAGPRIAQAVSLELLERIRNGGRKKIEISMGDGNELQRMLEELERNDKELSDA